MDLFSRGIEWFKEIFRDHIPVTNPVLVLSLVLLIILFSPLIFRRFRIPGIIGLILAGVIIGPNTLHIIEKTTSFELFSKTGVLYIMFLAGLEIDLQEYRQNRVKSWVFGAFTFLIPISIGYLTCIYVFHMPVLGALLLASMFSTHTLLSYPIVSNLGVTKNRAVQITFGGTIITDAAVLILLGIITHLASDGADNGFWWRLIIGITLTVFGITFLMPKISRWFFRNIEGQGSSQYIYVLSMMFLSAFIADIAGLESIVGAFLAGIALNKVIPHNSVLMNRIIFIGNTLFIPFFLIASGMLVDLRLFFSGTEALLYAGILSGVALFTKYLAAQVTGLLFGYNKYERRVIYGLSASHAAATLAVIRVGYDIGLIDQNAINGTILLILITCLASSFITERAARKLAIEEKDTEVKIKKRPERILVPISNPENLQRLIDFALIMKDEKSHEPIYPLTIVEDDQEASEKLESVKKVVEGIADQISSGDRKVEILKKVDLNITDGIVRTAKAYNITDIIISWKTHLTTSNLIFGTMTDNLLGKTNQTVFVSRIIQPLNTFNRVWLVFTPNAELENTFRRTCRKMGNILKQVGNSAVIVGTYDTLSSFKRYFNDKRGDMFQYKPVPDFESLDFLAKELTADDLLVIVSSRKQTLSYDYHIDRLAREISSEREYQSFLIYYPDLLEGQTSGVLSDITTAPIGENIEKILKVKEKLTGIFKKDE